MNKKSKSRQLAYGLAGWLDEIRPTNSQWTSHEEAFRETGYLTPHEEAAALVLASWVELFAGVLYLATPVSILVPVACFVERAARLDRFLSAWATQIDEPRRVTLLSVAKLTTLVMISYVPLSVDPD